MDRLNAFLANFNGTSAGHAVAILLFLLTGVIVAVRLAIGRPFPAGYEPWLLTLVTMAGVNAAAMGIKRVTDINYKAAGAPALTVESPGPVNVTNTAAAPPAAGVAAPAAAAQPDADKGGAQ